VEAWRNPGSTTLKTGRSEGAEENAGRRTLSPPPNIGCFFCAGRGSFAPSELCVSTADTQGSAKPPPWDKVLYAFGVLDIPGPWNQPPFNLPSSIRLPTLEFRRYFNTAMSPDPVPQ
jgi:hypothetical protein